MSERDMTADIDPKMNKGLARILYDGFNEGFDNDIIIAYNATPNKLKFEDSTGAFHELYVTGTTFTMPASGSLSVADSVVTYFGTGSDLGMTWDGTDFTISVAADDSVINVGDGTLSADLNWYGNTAADLINFDASSNMLYLDGVDLWLKDADILYFGDGKDLQMRWDGTNFDILAVEDDLVILVGTGTYSFDLTWYGNTSGDTIAIDASGNILTLNGIDLRLLDADILQFGDSQDATFCWDGTDFDIMPAADDSVLKFGDGTTSWDIWWYGNAAGNTVKFDAGANTLTLDAVDLYLGDGDILAFGDAQDATICWDATDLDIMPAANASILKFGDGTTSWDIWWYGSTAASTIVADEGADTLTLNGVDLYLLDADVLAFGDAQDVTITYDGTDLLIAALADDDVIKVGDGTTSFDLYWYGDTADDYVFFDASGNVLYLGQDDHGIGLVLYGATSGVLITWDQASDELDITATVEMQAASKLQFRDTAIYINSGTDAILNLVSDGEIFLNGRVRFKDANTETLSGAMTLTGASPMLQFVDPGGAARDVTLPVEATSAGLVFIIANTADAAEALTVKDDTPATVAVIDQDEMGVFICDGTTWKGGSMPEA